MIMRALGQNRKLLIHIPHNKRQKRNDGENNVRNKRVDDAREGLRDATTVSP